MILDTIVFESTGKLGIGSLKFIGKDGNIIPITNVERVDSCTVNGTLEDGATFNAISTNSFDDTYELANLFGNNDDGFRSADDTPVTVTITFDKLEILTKIKFKQMDTTGLQPSSGFEVRAYSGDTVKTIVQLKREFAEREVEFKHIVTLAKYDDLYYTIATGLSFSKLRFEVLSMNGSYWTMGALRFYTAKKEPYMWTKKTGNASSGTFSLAFPNGNNTDGTITHFGSPYGSSYAPLNMCVNTDNLANAYVESFALSSYVGANQGIEVAVNAPISVKYLSFSCWYYSGNRYISKFNLKADDELLGTFTTPFTGGTTQRCTMNLNDGTIVLGAIDAIE